MDISSKNLDHKGQYYHPKRRKGHEKTGTRLGGKIWQKRLESRMGETSKLKIEGTSKFQERGGDEEEISGIMKTYHQEGVLEGGTKLSFTEGCLRLKLNSQTKAAKAGKRHKKDPPPHAIRSDPLEGESEGEWLQMALEPASFGERPAKPAKGVLGAMEKSTSNENGKGGGPLYNTFWGEAKIATSLQKNGARQERFAHRKHWGNSVRVRWKKWGGSANRGEGAADVPDLKSERFKLDTSREGGAGALPGERNRHRGRERGEKNYHHSEKRAKKASAPTAEQHLREGGTVTNEHRPKVHGRGAPSVVMGKRPRENPPPPVRTIDRKRWMTFDEKSNFLEKRKAMRKGETTGSSRRIEKN